MHDLIVSPKLLLQYYIKILLHITLVSIEAKSGLLISDCKMWCSPTLSSH